MSINANILGALFAALTLPAMAEGPVQGWPSMSSVNIDHFINQVRDMPVSDLAQRDQPYCASQTEISQTLKHDFAEMPVGGETISDTQLWGSEVMGTWTLVLGRNDGSACIIASGIGFDGERENRVYYASIGLAEPERAEKDV